MYNTIIGLFEDGNRANRAITELLTAGIPRESIRVMSNDPNEGKEGGGKGILSGIKGFLTDIGVLSEDKSHGVPEEHINIYREGIRGGKTMLMVVADQAWSPRVVDMMERNGALNIDDGSPDLAQSALGTSSQQPAAQPSQYRGSTMEAYRGGVRVFPRSGQQDVSASSQQAVSPTTSSQQQAYPQSQQQVYPQSQQQAYPQSQQQAYPQSQQQAYPQSQPQAQQASQSTVQSVENQPGPVAESASRIVESRQAQGPQGINFETFEPDFRSNYQSMLGGTGYPWDYYVPAYRYGFDLGVAPGWPSDWQQVEPYARDQWERHNPNTWDRFKDAVRYSWQRARGALTSSATAPAAQPSIGRDSVPGR